MGRSLLPGRLRRNAALESLPIPSGLVTIVAFFVMLGLLVLVHERAFSNGRVAWHQGRGNWLGLPAARADTV